MRKRRRSKIAESVEDEIGSKEDMIILCILSSWVKEIKKFGNFEWEGDREFMRILLQSK